MDLEKKLFFFNMKLGIVYETMFQGRLDGSVG